MHDVVDGTTDGIVNGVIVASYCATISARMREEGAMSEAAVGFCCSLRGATCSGLQLTVQRRRLVALVLRWLRDARACMVGHPAAASGGASMARRTNLDVG